MPGHVFERGHDVGAIDGCVGRLASALQAVDRGHAHARDQVRILAVGFLDAAPARVACHIDHRGQHLRHATRARLARGHGEDLLGQTGVEAGGQSDGLGEAGGARGDQAVKSLLVQDGRDSEARFLD